MILFFGTFSQNTMFINEKDQNLILDERRYLNSYTFFITLMRTRDLLLSILCPSREQFYEPFEY